MVRVWSPPALWVGPIAAPLNRASGLPSSPGAAPSSLRICGRSRRVYLAGTPCPPSVGTVPPSPATALDWVEMVHSNLREQHGRAAHDGERLEGARGGTMLTPRVHSFLVAHITTPGAWGAWGAQVVTTHPSALCAVWIWLPGAKTGPAAGVYCRRSAIM